MKRLVGLFITLLVFSNVAFAEKTFKIGVENTPYFPHYLSEGNIFKGYAADVLDGFAKEKGYIFEYVALPIRRLFNEFLKENLDFKYPDNPYWAADEKKASKVIYSDSVAKYIDGVMVLPENKDMKTIKTLGIVLGFTAFEYLDEIKKGNITVIENPTFLGLLQQGKHGRIEGVYSNIDVAGYILKEIMKEPDSLVFNPNLPHTNSSYFLSTIKHPDIIKEFNEYMKENKTTIEALKKKYGIIER